MIIHNKYNEEWLGPPVNFIDKDTLEQIFSTFHSKYQIIYIRPQSNNIVNEFNKYCFDQLDNLV